MREILTDAQRAALTDETEFAAMVRAIRDVTGDDSIGADTSLRQFARYLLALDTRVRADAGKVGLSDLERFALAVLKEWHENGARGDVDGGWLQDEAERHGLVVPETRLMPCGEVCPCRDYAGGGIEMVRCCPIRDDVFKLMMTTPTGAPTDG